MVNGQLGPVPARSGFVRMRPAIARRSIAAVTDGDRQVNSRPGPCPSRRRNRGGRHALRAPWPHARCDHAGSDSCGVEGRSLEMRTRSRPQRRFAAAATKARKHRGMAGGWAKLVTNRAQKSAVNPLTRLASRSVIQRNYQSPHVEGPAATFDPCLTDIRPNCMSNCRSDCRFLGRNHRVGPTRCADGKPMFLHDPERPCP
jgi:hypothetical protein